MARRSHEDAFGVAGAETIIGTGVRVHGNLESESDIFIDGSLDGTITATGHVTVGVNAEIKATITAGQVTIAGSVHGNIQSDGETSILETGHLEGDVEASNLSIAPGGIFVGRSKVTAPARLSLDEPSGEHIAEVSESQKSNSRFTGKKR